MTQFEISYVNDYLISTHTLTWSVTRKDNTPPERDVNFNSHAHVERDGGATWIGHGVYISTHTLTWSVTKTLNNKPKTDGFQLTRSRGA